MSAAASEADSDSGNSMLSADQSCASLSTTNEVVASRMDHLTRLGASTLSAHNELATGQATAKVIRGGSDPCQSPSRE